MRNNTTVIYGDDNKQAPTPDIKLNRIINQSLEPQRISRNIITMLLHSHDYLKIHLG